MNCNYENFRRFSLSYLINNEFLNVRKNVLSVYPIYWSARTAMLVHVKSKFFNFSGLVWVVHIVLCGVAEGERR